MKNHEGRTRSRTRASLLLRMLVLLALGCFVGVGAIGCDDQTVTVANQGDPEGDGQGDGEPDPDGDPDGEPGDGDHVHDDGHGHGPDPDAEYIEVGILSGSWRAAIVEGDRPLAYFDLTHDEGAPSATGDYLMGLGAPDMDMLTGETGRISDVTLDGDSLEIAWNPTSQESEMYWVELTRESDDRFTGTFQGQHYPDTYEVTVDRRVFDDDEDSIPADSDELEPTD